MKKYNIIVKTEEKCDCGGVKNVWKPLTTSKRKVYEFTKEQAEKYLEMYSFSTPSHYGELLKIKEIK